MSKIIAAAQGRAQMVICEKDVDDDFQWEHSILVEWTSDGITIKGRDGEVFIPEYAVDALLRAVRAARSAGA